MQVDNAMFFEILIPMVFFKHPLFVNFGNQPDRQGCIVQTKRFFLRFLVLAAKILVYLLLFSYTYSTS